MNRLLVRIQNRLVDHDRGAAMAEYGLLLAFIALAVIGVMSALGGRLNELFGFASDTFADSPGGKLGAGSTTTGN